jgi:hypothetical protein
MHSYSNFESVYTASGGFSSPRIFSTVVLMATLVSNPCAILYSFDAKTVRVMRLHMSDDQCRMFALSYLSTSAIIYPICDEQLGLLAKELSVKIRRQRESSKRIKQSPRDAFSVCQVRILFSFFTSSSPGFTTCVAVESLYAASR